MSTVITSKVRKSGLPPLVCSSPERGQAHLPDLRDYDDR